MNALTIIIGLVFLVLIGIGAGIFGGEILTRFSRWRTFRKYEREYTVDNDLSRKGEEARRTNRSAEFGGVKDGSAIDTREGGVEGRELIPSEPTLLDAEDVPSPRETGPSTRGFFRLFRNKKQ